MKDLSYYEKRERTLGTQYFEAFNKKFHAYNFTPTKSRTGYDGTWTINQKDPSTFFEIKVRDFPIEKYSDYILEVRKADTLAKWNNQGFPVKYMNFFKNSDGTFDLIVFDLDFRIQQWRAMGKEKVVQKKWMNLATCISRTQKCEKEVIMISFDPMIDTKFEGFRWSLS